jgi:hypothetical protein
MREFAISPIDMSASNTATCPPLAVISSSFGRASAVEAWQSTS